MSEIDRTNRGSIWKNDKKDPARPDYRDTLPDFTGTMNVEGREFYVSAWKRNPDANPKAPALTWTVKLKEIQPVFREGRRPADPISTGRPDDLDDLIPF